MSEHDEQQPDPDTRAYLNSQVHAILAALVAGDVDQAMRLLGHLDREVDARAGGILLGGILRQITGNLAAAASGGDQRAVEHLRGLLDTITGHPAGPHTSAASSRPTIPGPRHLPTAAGIAGPGGSGQASAAGERLEKTAAAASAELGRIDGKTATLLGVLTAGLSVVSITGSGRHLPVISAGFLWFGAAALAAALVLLMLTILPDLTGETGWLGYATLTPHQALERAGDEDSSDLAAAEHAVRLAGLAKRKYRIQRAVIFLIFTASGWLVLALIGSIR